MSLFPAGVDAARRARSVAAATAVTTALLVPVGLPATAEAAPAKNTTKERVYKPRLKYGDKHRAVVQLKRKLDVNSDSKRFKEVLRKAVNAYKGDHGWKTNGRVGPRMWSVLLDRPVTAKKPKPKGERLRERVLKIAKKQRGKPYQYGADGPGSFDCSGFTGYVFDRAGKNLPRTSSQQYSAADRVSRRKAEPGDLIFFHGSGGVYHVGIYAGHGKLWDSPRSGSRVDKRPIWSSSVTFGRA